MEKINRVVCSAIVWITFSCEPLVTTFDDVENAVMYTAKKPTAVEIEPKIE